MGSMCSSVPGGSDRKVKLVGSLGKKEKGKTLAPAGVHTRGLDNHPGRRAVTCPEGHLMNAHIVHEGLFPVVCQTYCEARVDCEKCEVELSIADGHYVCKECDIRYCIDCAREELGLHNVARDGHAPPVGILPGDIFLCGPDPIGTHHVILSLGELYKADHDVAEALQLEPGMELWACQTIESTQGSVGDDTWWFPTETFFQRDPYSGNAELVADLRPNSQTIEKAVNPVPLKVLLHPFRGGKGGGDGPELDRKAFQAVVDEAAAESKKYGKRTIVRSLLESAQHHEVIHEHDRTNPEELASLMEEIRRSWSHRDICASVAVKCWQKYFEAMNDSPEEAAEEILDLMPHWCHRTLPSSLVKTLTLHDWVLLNNLDP